MDYFCGTFISFVLFALSVKDQFLDYPKYINKTKRINHDRTVIFGRTTLLK